jgi:hypothetical protein
MDPFDSNNFKDWNWQEFTSKTSVQEQPAFGSKAPSDIDVDNRKNDSITVTSQPNGQKTNSQRNYVDYKSSQIFELFNDDSLPNEAAFDPFSNTVSASEWSISTSEAQQPQIFLSYDKPKDPFPNKKSPPPLVTDMRQRNTVIHDQHHQIHHLNQEVSQKNREILNLRDYTIKLKKQIEQQESNFQETINQLLNRLSEVERLNECLNIPFFTSHPLSEQDLTKTLRRTEECEFSIENLYQTIRNIESYKVSVGVIIIIFRYYS